MAEDEERAKKRQRLTGNDWEAKVLGVGDYSKFLPDNKVPFVNRHNELCDLFHVNAAVILKLLECRRDKEGIDNWRPCSVAMAAQMFGSGKTTLGRNFIKQLKDQETNNFIQEKLTGDDWRDELTRAQRAESKHYNLNGCKTLHDVAKMLDYDQFKALSSTGALDIAKYIFRLAVETGEKPLFVHFDEIGDLQANVKELREAVRQVWELMLQYAGDMPRVYFFLSGKSVPLNAIGGSGSPVGTKWIILDLLKELLPVLR